MNTPGASLASAPDIGLAQLRSEPRSPLAPWDRLLRLAALERADIVVVVVYAIAIGLVSLAVPIAAQSLVNTVAFTALLQPIVVLSTLVLVGLLAAGLLRVLQYRVVETLQQRFFVRTTHEAVRRLAEADVRTFDDQGAPEVVNRFFDVATIQKASATLLLDGLSVVLQGCVSLVLLAFYHPALLAFDVVLVALIAFTLFGLGRDGVSTSIKESKAKYATAAWLEETARALRTFKSTEGAEFAFARGDAHARAYVEARRKHFKVLLRQIISSQLLQAVATAGLLGLGGSLVIKGELTLGQLVASELIVTGVLSGVAKFGKYLETYYDLAASLDKVGTIVDLPSERSGGARQDRQVGPARLDVEGVAYSYDGSTLAVSDVTLSVAPGACLAVLGTASSGKSTLVDIVSGLRAPSQGRVKLDGLDIRTLALQDLRRDIAVVSGTEIFDGTVLDNVRCGRSGVDAVAVIKALRLVALDEEVGALPDGALTSLGHAGSRLTTSQAARLMIARGLVAEGRLLVIDEALDSLGTDMARRVLRSIAAARGSTSTLVFTSRADIAREVETIATLDKGVLLGGTAATNGEVPA